VNHRVEPWQKHLDAFLTRAQLTHFDRAIVVPECASTQDEAFRLAEGRAGLIVTTIAQSAGRGRLGRFWHHDSTLGLAMTFTLPRAIPPAHVSIAAGVAAATACTRPNPDSHTVGVRWPNDIVERFPTMPGVWRKLGGVLAEAREGLLLLGIGINLNQALGDWGPGLAGRAMSVREVWNSPEPISREAFCETLTRALNVALSTPLADLVPEWERLDVLLGTVQSFDHDGRRYVGMVEDLDPVGSLLLRAPDGSTITLPALTTSLVKD
jgi:BirA family biotin operon repressor/biotin-[acetyl-CoA-carboxylase] ligase